MENLKSRQLCLKYAEGRRMANDDAKDMKQKQESYVRGWLQRTDVEDGRVRFPTVNTDSATSHMFNSSSTLKLSNYDLRLFPSVSALILCSRSTVVYRTWVIYLVFAVWDLFQPASPFPQGERIYSSILSAHTCVYDDDEEMQRPQEHHTQTADATCPLLSLFFHNVWLKA